MIWLFSLGLCFVLVIGLFIVFNPDWLGGYFGRRWDNPHNHYKHY